MFDCTEPRQRPYVPFAWSGSTSFPWLEKPLERGWVRAQNSRKASSILTLIMWSNLVRLYNLLQENIFSTYLFHLVDLLKIYGFLSSSTHASWVQRMENSGRVRLCCEKQLALHFLSMQPKICAASSHQITPCIKCNSSINRRLWASSLTSPFM